MISAVIAVLGLIASIGTFFAFDIKTIYAIRSGKELRKAMQQSQEQYAATGSMRKNMDFDYDTQSIGKKNRSAKFKSRMDKGQKTASGKLPAPQLANVDNLPETVAMNTPAPAVQPAMAAPPAAETTVLEQSYNNHQPSHFVRAEKPVETPGFRFEMIEDIVVTHTDEIVY